MSLFTLTQQEPPQLESLLQLKNQIFTSGEEQVEEKDLLSEIAECLSQNLSEDCKEPIKSD
jgi:hypothetical protein